MILGASQGFYMLMQYGGLDGVMVAIGAAIGMIGIAVAYLKYMKKDIH